MLIFELHKKHLNKEENEHVGVDHKRFLFVLQSIQNETKKKPGEPLRD